MALGYANARPPVHGLILERAFAALGREMLFERALDVGCGSGVSTRALARWARRLVGVEPAVGMAALVGTVAPGAGAVAGAGEALPFRDGSFDVATAAGSLNYVSDLGRTMGEVRRVLRRGGVLVVYDFAAGRSFADSPALDEWFAEFQRRYPPPAHEARYLDPGVLEREAAGFRMEAAAPVEARIPFRREAYAAYMMTETNVAAAVRRGGEAEPIRAWCDESLAAMWGGEEREVVFRGYFACLAPEPG